MGDLRGRVAAITGWLFAGRFRVAGVVLAVFLAVGLLTRLGLALFTGFAFQDWMAFSPARLPLWLGVGMLFDVAVAGFLMVPFALVAWLVPDTRRSRWLALPLTRLLSLTAFAAFVFVAASEFVFWNEFGARFNFIAVDYLVYTNEVIGNIRESYSMPLLFGAIGVATLALLALVARPLLHATAPAGTSWRRRSAQMAVFAALPLLSFGAVDARFKDFTTHTPSSQLAGNGWFEFLHAFRHNEIDYAQFYRTLPVEQAVTVLRRELLGGAPGTHFVADSPMPTAREVRSGKPDKRLNVVLISVESLSAEFLGAFGNTQGITPRLDALARDSLLFTRLYATGTRTVRGLEAIALSLPPTPGHSVVKRPDNGNLHTLGEVFAAKGYEPIYLYGGYSYFDNMREFFGGNGYTVIDRAALAKDEIHYENIWGVADEDLFTLSLRELDQRAAAGKPFFAHVMTTSNHRPFSYPAGRIDLPTGKREGAVKYTDWAIGDFIERARAKPWFRDTVFVILADHCAASRGKTDLPIDRFHIPMLVYAPAHVAPGRVDHIASQIDVAPTLLALLDFSYTSHFFGHDILTAGARHPRALMANYQTVGYLQDDVLVELRPKGRYRFVDPHSGRALDPAPQQQAVLDEAIAYYQTASSAFRSGAMRRVAGATDSGAPDSGAIR
ncbi:MAG: LTA synthase family protein [Betaproteobacteria bacterium]